MHKFFRDMFKNQKLDLNSMHKIAKINYLHSNRFPVKLTHLQVRILIIVILNTVEKRGYASLTYAQITSELRRKYIKGNKFISSTKAAVSDLIKKGLLKKEGSGHNRANKYSVVFPRVVVLPTNDGGRFSTPPWGGFSDPQGGGKTVHISISDSTTLGSTKKSLSEDYDSEIQRPTKDTSLSTMESFARTHKNRFGSDNETNIAWFITRVNDPDRLLDIVIKSKFGPGPNRTQWVKSRKIREFLACQYTDYGAPNVFSMANILLWNQVRRGLSVEKFMDDSWFPTYIRRIHTVLEIRNENPRAWTEIALRLGCSDPTYKIPLYSPDANPDVVKFDYNKMLPLRDYPWSTDDVLSLMWIGGCRNIEQAAEIMKTMDRYPRDARDMILDTFSIAIKKRAAILAALDIGPNDWR